jgi:DNA-binding NarL/FixJ family response regulator
MANSVRRVFLVDDHDVVRQGLAELVAKSSDFLVVGQCDGGFGTTEQILAAEADIVLLDISLPGQSGLDVCRELTRKRRSLAVLILSMHAEEEFIARALENGACGYMMKDGDAGQLFTALEMVSRGDLYLAPGIPRTVLQRLGRRGDDPYDRLTSRERQVLKLVAEGKTNREAAEALGVAVKTVDTHRTRLMRKLDIHDQTSLVKFAIKKKVVAVDEALP